MKTPKMIKMTLEAATKKYIDAGKTLPPNLFIIPPKVTSASARIKAATKGKPANTFGNVDIRNGVVYIDGVKQDKPVPGINIQTNRAQRRAKK